MDKKIYVCHANECICNKQGSCSNDFGITIAVYDGVAMCPNYTPMDVKKLELIEGMYQALESVLLEVHGDAMDEDIRGYELFTNNEDGASYMCEPGNDNLQELALDRRVSALVDAINVLKLGEVVNF